MTGHSRPKDGVLSHAYAPTIRVFLASNEKTRMPGTRHVLEPAFCRARVPGMTKSYAAFFSYTYLLRYSAKPSAVAAMRAYSAR